MGCGLQEKQEKYILRKEERGEKGVHWGKYLKMRRKRISKNVFEVQQVNESIDLSICKLRSVITFQMI